MAGNNANTKLLLHANGGDGVKSAFAHVKCNEVSGTNVSDAGTGANTFTASTDTSNLTVAGKINNAFDFNGTTEYVNVDALATDIASDTTGSISFWVNPDDVDATTKDIFSITDASGAPAFIVNVKSGNLRVICEEPPGAYWYLLTQTISASEWSHWAIVQNGTAPKVYKNGVDITGGLTLNAPFDGTQWISSLSNIDSGRIGCIITSGGGNSAFFPGKIDDFRYFKCALSQTEIDTLYNSGSGTENSIILDASGGAHTEVQTYGDAQLDTAQKKWSTASLLFDGTGDYVKTPATSFGDVVGDNADDWTIDLQANQSSLTASQTLFAINDGGDSDQLQLYSVASGTAMALEYRVGGAYAIHSTEMYKDGLAVTGSWVHWAAIKNGSVYSLYKNGTQVLYGWSPLTTTLTTASVGAKYRVPGEGGTVNVINGNIDEFRVQADNYFLAAPNSFPAAPLLVYGQDNLISDGSIDDEDMADISDWTDNDSSSGASTQVTFDGRSTMKLDTGASIDGQAKRSQDVGTFGTKTVVSGNFYFDNISTVASGNVAYLWVQDGTTKFRAKFSSEGIFIYDGAVYNEVGTDLVVLDTWQEWTFDIDWTAQTCNVYLDKTLVGTGIDASFSSAGTNGLIDILVDSSSGANWIAYVDWIKTGLSQIGNEGYGDDAISTGTAGINSAQKKFNADTSLFFDGNSDYLTVTDTSGTDYDILGSLTDIWTVDTWVRFNGIGVNQAMLDQREDSGGNNVWSFFITSSNFVKWQSYNGGFPFSMTSTATVTTGQWYHIAGVKSGTSMGIYLDGVQIGYDTLGSTDTFAASLGVGGDTFGSNNINGYMEQVQITKANKFGVVPLSEPFSFMKMEDNTDEGTGANAVTNIGTPTYTAGKLNNALTLNGTDQALNVNALEVDIGADTTGSFSFWLYPDSAGDGSIFTIADASAVTYFRIAWVDTNDRMNLALKKPGTSYFEDAQTTSGSVPVSTWTHIAFVQDGTELKAYINGEENTLTYVTSELDKGAWLSDLVAANLDNARIGCDNYNSVGNSYFYGGKIDDFRYYQNTVLSSSQVSTLYNGGDGIDKWGELTIPTAVLTQDTITEPTEEYSPDANLARSQAVIIA